MNDPIVTSPTTPPSSAGKCACMDQQRRLPCPGRHSHLAPVLMGVFLLASPVIAAAATATTTITASLASVVSFSSGSTVDLSVVPSAQGAQTIANDTVVVSSSDAAGYSLTLSDADTATGLASGPDTITTSISTVASPAQLIADSWGFRVDGLGGFGAGPTQSASSQPISSSKFAGIPASTDPVTIKSTSTIGSGDPTVIWYSAAADFNQPSGTYADSVVYSLLQN